MKKPDFFRVPPNKILSHLSGKEGGGFTLDGWTPSLASQPPAPWEIQLMISNDFQLIFFTSKINIVEEHS